MNRKIVIIIKQSLDRLPPILNLIDTLLLQGMHVSLICTDVIPELKDTYNGKVDFNIVDADRRGNKIVKLLNWLLFKRYVRRFLDKMNQDTLVWIGSADAALAIGNQLFKYEYVFQCHELYDAFPFYRKRLGVFMKNARLVITPNAERGAIFRSWYKLKSSPFILPNKSLRHPMERNLFIEDEKARELIASLSTKKILLYQGGIVAQRDIRKIAEAVKLLREEWALVLMGNTDNSTYLDDLIRDFPDIIYISRISAPKHLQITSWAHIGIVSYAYDDLNHVFCAPNKTWEYSGFGIPLLGNNVPGIVTDLQKFHSGEAVDLDNSTTFDIADKIKLIDEKYMEYSVGANLFYESVNLEDIVSDILILISK